MIDWLCCLAINKDGVKDSQVTMPVIGGKNNSGFFDECKGIYPLHG